MQSEFEELAHTVYQTLIKPWKGTPNKDLLKGNLITVIPDDFFYLLPFEPW